VFRELAPNPDVLPTEVDGVPIRQVLRTMNDRIEYLVDREHRIGHAFFVGCSSRSGPGGIDAVMRDKVIPLLQEYFFEDWGRVAAVLGEPGRRGGGFLDCRTLEDPTGQGGEPRQSWSVRPDFSEDAYRDLIGQAAAVPPDMP
jgi:5-methylcytosine-specific restriction endonuclease McrBC GTP-binding regulatory subunit McrB